MNGQHQFLKDLRLAYITFVFRKEANSLSKNYTPVSALPVIPKIYKRYIQKQTYLFIDTKHSSNLGGYKKAYSS